MKAEEAPMEEVWQLNSADDLSLTSSSKRYTRRVDRAPGSEDDVSTDGANEGPFKLEKVTSDAETLRSMSLNTEDNKIMRVPNLSMMLYHEREFVKFLHNVKENPGHFAGFVAECRVASDRHNAQYAPPDPVAAFEGDVQDEFRIEKPLAATRFARIFYAMRKQDRFPCALKQLHRMPRLVRTRPAEGGLNNDEWFGQYSILENQMIMAEVSRLRQLEHENIVTLFDAFEEGDCLNVVSEWCGGGSLAYKLLNLARKRQALDERTMWAYFSQTCAGVQYLHDNGLYHLNLRPANVLFNSQGQIKITDIGVHALERRVYTSLQNDAIGQEIDALCGICPEILGDFLKEVEERSFCQSERDLSTGVTISAAKAAAGDSWALGSILYEMAELRPPFLFPGMQGNPLALVRTSLRLPATLGMSNNYTRRLEMLVERLLISRSVDRIGVETAAQAALKACCDENEAFHTLLVNTKNTYDSPKYSEMNKSPWTRSEVADGVDDAFRQMTSHQDGHITSGQDILQFEDNESAEIDSDIDEDGIVSPDPIINSSEFEELCGILDPMTTEEVSEAKTPLALFAQPAPINTAIARRSTNLSNYPLPGLRGQNSDGNVSGASTPGRRKRQHNPLSPEHASSPLVMLVHAGRTHSEPSLLSSLPRRRASPSPGRRANRWPTPPRPASLRHLDVLQSDRRSRNGTPTHMFSQLSLMSEEPVGSMVSSPGKRRRQERQKVVHNAQGISAEPLTLNSPASRVSRSLKPDLIEEAKLEEFARTLYNKRGSLPRRRGRGNPRRQSWN